MNFLNIVPLFFSPVWHALFRPFFPSGTSSSYFQGRNRWDSWFNNLRIFFRIFTFQGSKWLSARPFWLLLMKPSSRSVPWYDVALLVNSYWLSTEIVFSSRSPFHQTWFFIAQEKHILVDVVDAGSKLSDKRQAEIRSQIEKVTSEMTTPLLALSSTSFISLFHQLLPSHTSISILSHPFVSFFLGLLPLIHSPSPQSPSLHSLASLPSTVVLKSASTSTQWTAVCCTSISTSMLRGVFLYAEVMGAMLAEATGLGLC